MPSSLPPRATKICLVEAAPVSLITGITGFAGSHLAELLLSRGHRVYGTIRVRSRTENIEHLMDQLNLVECDLTDAGSVDRLFSQVEPRYVFHLAAQSFVPTSWREPVLTFQTNAIGQINLLEAIRRHGYDPVIQIACSSEEYGAVRPEEIPITEETPLRPLSPYAVSKVAQDLLGYQYFKSWGMRIIRTRAFNHTGPRRGEQFVASNFAKQLVEIELGMRPPIIEVGNLEAKRDFTDVRDIVRGYLMVVEEGEPGEVYNLCSGRSVKIERLLEMLIALSGLEVEIRPDPARMRPSDLPVLEGDYSKFHQRTGWRPEIELEQTLSDLINYWRARLAG